MQRGAPFVERDFVRQPLTVDEILTLLAGRPAGEIFSWKSVRARREGIQPGRHSDEELIRLMAADANLIRRPLLVVGDRLLAGFAPAVWEQTLVPRTPLQ